MKRPCLSCGAEMIGSRQPHRYGRGIDVVLDDVLVWACPSCGEREAVIENIEELHQSIARRIACAPGRLTAGEIRWLRTHLGYSSIDFAEVMGVRAETVSRWERVEMPTAMHLPSEMALRLMALSGVVATDYGLTIHERKKTREPSPHHVKVQNGAWG